MHRKFAGTKSAAFCKSYDKHCSKPSGSANNECMAATFPMTITSRFVESLDGPRKMEVILLFIENSNELKLYHSFFSYSVAILKIITVDHIFAVKICICQ